MKLQNKVAVITGAASGIGKAIAHAFSDEGADIAILDINVAGADEVAEAIRGKGRKACVCECDVGYSEPVDRAFEQTAKQLGGVDILVNNAGIIRQHPVVDTPEDEWDLILRTNLKSVFLCSKAAAGRMIQQGRGGRIISISSIHAVVSEPGCGHLHRGEGRHRGVQSNAGVGTCHAQNHSQLDPPGSYLHRADNSHVHGRGREITVRTGSDERNRSRGVDRLRRGFSCG